MQCMGLTIQSITGYVPCRRVLHAEGQIADLCSKGAVGLLQHVPNTIAGEAQAEAGVPYKNPHFKGGKGFPSTVVPWYLRQGGGSTCCAQNAARAWRI